MPMNAMAGVTETTGVQGIQQNGRTVTVTVKDALGEVIGANVLVKGTTIGGITNMEGVAVIQGVPDNATIQVSFVGYVTQEIALQNGQTSLEVTLREDSETLEEVVVVGYFKFAVRI
ncbi:MAG: carboxypeptidase-like regulatory domain-containing protein [Bacteroidaceae bacterium]|nr:carboxypeptidase-like regulatory domain-containing protein [Bacteroidaceae bacterium]